MEVCDGCRDHLQILNMLEEPRKVDCHCKCLYILQTQCKIRVNGWPAVVYAARHGHDTCLQAIIQAGTDVNTRDGQRCTALINAAQFDHVLCLEILLKAGADVNLKEHLGYSALHLTCMGSSENKQNHVKCIDLLIQAGANVNSTSSSITPLMVLAKCTYDNNCLNALIEAGADVNAGYSETPLAITVRQGAEKNVKLMIEAGANVNTVVSGHLTPLLLAIKRDKYVRLLINSGADVNYVPDWYDSCLL